MFSCAAGYGLEKGGISCVVTNTLDHNLTVIYLDVLPWFTRVYLKSLTVENNGFNVDCESDSHSNNYNYNSWPVGVVKL